MQNPVVVGDTLDFPTTLEDYPASAGWTLSYRLVPFTSGSPITLTATASGDSYRVTQPAATTATWAAGEYSWSAYVSNGSERYTVESGTVTLAVDPATVAAFDGRSQARIALEAVEAVLAKRATLDQEQYSIAGRSLQRTPMADLLKLRSALRADVAREDAANRRALGLDDGRRIYLRVGNA